MDGHRLDTHTHPDLHAFTVDFFRLFGADVRPADEDGGALHVQLPAELAAHFGRPELALCFHNAGGANQRDLVAHGSRAFDRMMGYLERQSAATVLQLPVRHAGGEELLRAVQPMNASISALRMKEEQRPLFLFNWRITYRADDKREELLAVVLDEAGNRLQSDLISDGDVPLDGFWADAQPPAADAEGERQHGAIRLPPMTQLTWLAETARKYAIYHADVQCLAHEAEILPRLHKVLDRLTSYYGQQMDEIAPGHDPDGEKRRRLDADLQRKIDEEIETHRLRVNVQLFGYGVLLTPYAIAEITLNDGKQVATARVARNCYSGAIEQPACHACGEQTRQLVLDRNGHITCDNCLLQCSSCMDILCAACGVAPCPVCGKSNCDQCGQLCWACGERACADHASVCPICGDTVCHACQAQCAQCGARQCRAHLRVDHVLSSDGESVLICPVCAVRCPGCQQYSSQVEVCTASGQRFCTRCLVTCTGCGRQVGSGFYQVLPTTGRPYCLSCVHECPACHRLSPAAWRCHTCGAGCCDQCGRTCDLCRRTFCAAHATQDAFCGHTVCLEHSATCELGGERVCAVCHETCAICERFFCTNHAETCRLCGCAYCRDCVGSSGLCQTCAGMQEVGVPLDPSAEPWAVDPQVSGLKGYQWLRVGNRRYAIYQGRGPLGLTAVVVTDNASGAARLVRVRRLTGDDLFVGRRWAMR